MFGVRNGVRTRLPRTPAVFERVDDDGYAGHEQTDTQTSIAVEVAVETAEVAALIDNHDECVSLLVIHGLLKIANHPDGLFQMLQKHGGPAHIIRHLLGNKEISLQQVRDLYADYKPGNPTCAFGNLTDSVDAVKNAFDNYRTNEAHEALCARRS